MSGLMSNSENNAVGETAKLTCGCGVQFACHKTSECWCMNLPNMRGWFDLAEACMCPNCLTLGQSKAITRQRRAKRAVRASNAIR